MVRVSLCLSLATRALSLSFSRTVQSPLLQSPIMAFFKLLLFLFLVTLQIASFTVNGEASSSPENNGCNGLQNHLLNELKSTVSSLRTVYITLTRFDFGSVLHVFSRNFAVFLLYCLCKGLVFLKISLRLAEFCFLGISSVLFMKNCNEYEKRSFDICCIALENSAEMSNASLNFDMRLCFFVWFL